MNHIRQLHKEAMDLAEMAFIARLKGDLDQAVQLSRQAYEGEAEVARLMSAAGATEPTRSVFYRSAASLALNCNEFREAERLIAEGLAGDPPEEIAEELRELYERVNFQRHLELRGISLKTNEVQMVLAGYAINNGIAPIAEFTKRLDYIRQLFNRTIERKIGKSYREGGLPSREVRAYQTYISSDLRAASFAVSLRITAPREQLFSFMSENKLPEPDEIIDDILNCFDLLDKSKKDELQNKIPDPVYYRNFIVTAKKIAPDGSNVKLVGFTTILDDAERKVKLITPRNEISLLSIGSEGDGDSDTERKTIAGTLLHADAMFKKQRMIGIIDDQYKKYSIIVQKGLDDIVRPLWGQEVIAEVFVSGNKIRLIDIEAATT